MTETRHALATDGVQIPPQRYYGFDALRVIAVALVILFHASIPFMQPAYFFWPAADACRSAFFGHFSHACLAVCLPAMFLLAGFFASMSRRKRGVRGFFKGRFKRIVLPLIISAVTLVPMLQLLTVMGARRMDGAALARIDAIGIPSVLRESGILELFRSGAFIETFRWWHLWFLMYLLIYYVLHAAWRPLIQPLLAGGWADRAFSAIVRSPAGVVVLAIPTAILLHPMTSVGADTPSSVGPVPRILLYYMLFYVFGCMLMRRSEVLTECSRCWKSHLVVAVMVALPSLIYFRSQIAMGGDVAAKFRTAALICNSLFIWLMVFGLIGLCQRHLNKPNSAIRYMADASFWFYLVHLPPMILVQVWIKDATFGAAFKLVLVLAAVMLPLIAVYHYIVRRAFIGGVVAATADSIAVRDTVAAVANHENVSEIRC